MQESDVALLLAIAAMATSIFGVVWQVRTAGEKDDIRDALNAIVEMIEEIEAAGLRYYARAGNDPATFDDEKLILAKLKQVGVRIGQLQLSAKRRERLQTLHRQYRQAATFPDFQSRGRLPAATGSDQFTRISTASTALTVELLRP